jgi:D-amino-acid dehydrogenase
VPGSDVVVVGGGLVGTALAYELAGGGASVTLIDRHDPGRATDAGAGILSPETMSEDDPDWYRLATGAADHYRALVPELEAHGERRTGYAACGALRLAFREWEDDLYTANLALARLRCLEAIEEVTPEEARRRFPPLGEIRAAWCNASAARIDGRAITAALLDATRARGVTVVGASVDDLVTSGARITGVQAAGSTIGGGAFVIAGGAWTPAFESRLRATIPVIPVRGQIVHVRVEHTDTTSWPILQPLLSWYMVPWDDGRVAVGGTLEPEAGFDARPTAGGLRGLFSEMLRLAPALADATFVEVRAGLRPVSADDRPVLGPLPGWDNAFVCTGHGANGLLLGPYSARLVADRVLGRDPGPLVDVFSADRFV